MSHGNEGGWPRGGAAEDFIRILNPHYCDLSGQINDIASTFAVSPYYWTNSESTPLNKVQVW